MELASDDKRMECLKTFSECQDVVTWIRQITKGLWFRKIKFIAFLFGDFYRCGGPSKFCERGPGHCCGGRGCYGTGQAVPPAHCWQWLRVPHLRPEEDVWVQGTHSWLQVSVGCSGQI